MNKKLSTLIALCCVIMFAFTACAANERNNSSTNPARNNTEGTDNTAGLMDDGTTGGAGGITGGAGGTTGGTTGGAGGTTGGAGGAGGTNGGAGGAGGTTGGTTGGMNGGTTLP
jgi:hypothetical protein